jgi:hypothetical protein
LDDQGEALTISAYNISLSHNVVNIYTKHLAQYISSKQINVHPSILYTYNLFNPLLALLTATLGFTTGAGTELTTLTGLLIFPSSNLPSFSFSIIGLCS